MEGNLMRYRAQGLFVLLACLAGSSGCAGGPSAVSAFSPPPASSTASAVPQLGHVFLLIEENHSFGSMIGNPAMPYLNQLATRYGLATQYFANAHPSLPNYFELTTGQTITLDDNFSGTVTQDNVVRELIAAGKTWRSYIESLPSVGRSE